MANLERIEYHRLESNNQMEKVAILVEREVARLGAERKYSGRVSTLRHIQATADRIARDIIEDIRRTK